MQEGLEIMNKVLWQRIETLEDRLSSATLILLHLDYRLDEELPIHQNGIVHTTVKAFLKDVKAQ